MKTLRRPPIVGRFLAEEVALASRNSGMPLEALRYDVTPVGLHYLLIHFDIPAVEAAQWTLPILGCVDHPTTFSLADLQALPQRTVRVTLECAGNGRAQLTPRNASMPWVEEGVSTAEWTGTPLAEVLKKAGLQQSACEVVFTGADVGIDRGVEQTYARSLRVPDALHPDVLLVWAMNGQPLLPQHGAPMRLIVPGWYGMASVKWLSKIEAVTQPFQGMQQVVGYHFLAQPEDAGVPCTQIRVNALMVPPGIPDFFSRQRFLKPGLVNIQGRAWSGGGVPITRVEFAVNGQWRDAQLHRAEASPWAWRGWSCDWQASTGTHVLAVRATDANGHVQPDQPVWDIAGFGNNGMQTVTVQVNAATQQ